MRSPCCLYDCVPPSTLLSNSLKKSKSKSHCDWRSVSQSVSLGVERHLGLMTRYLLLFDSYGLVSVGRPLWREDGSVFCICCWPLPAHSFSGPSPLWLAPIFYCLRFETSLFVASYDSQGHGGGIRPRLHTGKTSPQLEKYIPVAINTHATSEILLNATFSVRSVLYQIRCKKSWKEQKYDHESRRSAKPRLCWRRPAAIYLTDRPEPLIQFFFLQEQNYRGVVTNA
jgi:hypothetical protein